MRHFIDLMFERFKSLDSQKRTQLGIALSLLLLIIVLLSFANQRIATLVKKRASRETDLVQMMTLKQRYLSARVQSQRFSNRLSATRADDSPAKIIEEIGLKGKTSQIVPVKGEDRGEYVEDAAEIKLEGLSANETINLFYRLEKGTRPVLIKKANIRTRFDDPAKLDLTLTLALLKISQPGRR
jgi:general secretion pathway protein M